jgi:hypothetical protein
MASAARVQVAMSQHIARLAFLSAVPVIPSERAIVAVPDEVFRSKHYREQS